MNSRERILAVFNGKKVDRTPWIPLFSRTFLCSLPEYREKFPFKWWESNVGLSGDRIEEELQFRIDFYKSIGADFMAWSGTPGFGGETKNVKVESEKENNDLIIRYETPVGNLQMAYTGGPEYHMPYCKESLLKTDEDFEIYKYVLENNEFTVDLSKVQKVMDVLGDDGVIFTGFPGAPMHDYLHDMFGAEKFLIMLFDNKKKKKLETLFDIQDRNNIKMCNTLAELPLKTFLHQCSWDIGLISPDIYKEHYVPFLKKYNQILHREDKICLDHLSGQKIKPFLEGMEQTEMDGFHGITFPAVDGDIGMAELARRWQEKKIVPIGGLSPHFLATSTPEAVSEMTKRILDEVKDMPFILGTADDTVFGTPINNLEMVSNAIREFYG